MDNRFFYCYSCAMKDHLKKQGFRYIMKGLHAKSRRPFFVFEKSKELDNAILEWNKVKFS